jgi:putative nucleotidyltransferase with HDIG domain
MLRYGILADLLPELSPLVDYPQTAHHAHDAWRHTLAVVDYCRQIAAWIEAPEEAIPTNKFLFNATRKLRHFQGFLKKYINDPDFQSRPLRLLFLFAALYHDTGKPSTRSETSDGVQFVDHEVVGAQIAAARARALSLSSREVDFIEAVIRHHMVIHTLVKQKNNDLRETAFEYFRATGHAGVADCLFSLSDLLATYEEKMDEKRWEAGVAMSCNLLDAWVNQYKQVIEPDLWLDGDEIKSRLNILEGPLVGQLLSALKKAQAMGKVNSKTEAIEFINIMMSEKKAEQNDLR